MTPRRVAVDATWIMREGFAVQDVQYPTQRSIFLELLTRAAVEGLALGLALLDEGLAAKILLLGYKESRLEIAAGSESRLEADDAALRVALDSNALGYLKNLVLVAVRDGLAPVDHVDIDLCGDDPAASPPTFTVWISQR